MFLTFLFYSTFFALVSIQRTLLRTPPLFFLRSRFFSASAFVRTLSKHSGIILGPKSVLFKYAQRILGRSAEMKFGENSGPFVFHPKDTAHMC